MFVAILLAQTLLFKSFVTSGPTTFDPAHFYGTESSYIFRNIYRGLYIYDDEKGLVPEGAKKCTQSGLRVRCFLQEQVQWSDGSFVVASDYVRAFQYLIDPKTKSREISFLLNLKNARAILKKQKPIESLGIKAVSDFELLFEFDQADPEFLEKLTSPLLVPWKVKPLLDQPKSLISNGPYVVDSFIKDQKIVLKPNPFYFKRKLHLPNVEFLFLTEDSTGQSLFDAGKIDFQHRVDVSLIPQLKNQKNFYQKVFSRFDYIGFGPEFMKDKNLRIAVAHALDYEELSRMLHAAGRPGCTGLTATFSDTFCYDFNLSKAKNAFKKVPEYLKNRSYVLKYSKAGGDNIARTMEWYQHQLKKNLGLKIYLEPQEQGMYLQSIQLQTPDLFRKGINLDRPSCTSALESFRSDSPDNYVKYKSKEFDSDLSVLEQTADVNLKKSKCNKMIQKLMDEYILIPQGVIHYSMLSNEKFKGWKLNVLNQLDLSELTLNTNIPQKKTN